MIKIAANPTYTAPCKFQRPIDNGKQESVLFTARFTRQTQEQVATIYKRLGALAGAPKVKGELDTEVEQIAPLDDEGLVREVMCGWGPDVCDEQGTPLEFNDANLSALLNEHGATPAIVRAFFESIRGAAAKN